MLVIQWLETFYRFLLWWNRSKDVINTTYIAIKFREINKEYFSPENNKFFCLMMIQTSSRRDPVYLPIYFVIVKLNETDLVASTIYSTKVFSRKKMKVLEDYDKRYLCNITMIRKNVHIHRNPKNTKHWRLFWFRYETFITFLTFRLSTRAERATIFLCWLFHLTRQRAAHP